MPVRGPHGPIGVVGLRERGTEHGHNRIPHVLHHRSPFFEDGGVHLAAVNVELTGQHRRVGHLGDGAVTPDVRHEDGHLHSLRAPGQIGVVAQLLGQTAGQQPAQSLTLFLAIHDGALQKAQTAQGPLTACRHPFGQLHEQRLDGGVGCLGGGVPGHRDGLHRPPLGHFLQQGFFLVRKLTFAPNRRHQGGHDFGVEHRPSGRHLPDRGRQAVPVAHPILEEVGVAGCSLLQQGNGVFGLVVLREHDDARTRMALADLPGRLYALALEGRRHPDVGHHDLRVGLLGGGHQLVIVGSDADHLEVGLQAQKGSYPLAHQHAVVGQNHGDRLRTRIGRPRVCSHTSRCSRGSSQPICSAK